MSSAKPLCVLCERPTADGAVQAVQLDKERLQAWLIDVCGNEFAEEIEDHDLICNFCVWHSEFLEKHDSESEANCWWPQDEQYLDDAAKELRNYYFDGMVEQCWVQLEKIEESEAENEAESTTKTEMKRKKCPFCDKLYNHLAKHVKYAHKNAIRCENKNCATYFHTIEEKAEHNKNFHEIPRERKIIQCPFCEKEFQGNDNYRQHVRNLHTEYPVKCFFRGCIDYFKSETEMKTHFDLTHKEEDQAKVRECEYCGFRAKKIETLESHVAAKHLPKSIKCDKCDKWFSTVRLLQRHDLQDHKFKKCSICDAKVTAHDFRRHLSNQKCQRCKNRFDCAGLLQTHRKTCKETLLKCSKCQMTFAIISALNYHENRNHGINSWRGLKNKNLGFKCQPCKKYFKSAIYLKSHLNNLHSDANLKYCAHCTKSFHYVYSFKNHMAMRHNLIEKPFECDFCKRKYYQKSELSRHIEKFHLEGIREKCAICGKEMTALWMKSHLLNVHNKC